MSINGCWLANLGYITNWVHLWTPYLSVVSSNPMKGSRSFLEQDCLVLVGSRNRFKSDVCI